MSIWTPGGKEAKSIWVNHNGEKKEVQSVWTNKDGALVRVYGKKGGLSGHKFVAVFSYTGLRPLIAVSEDLNTWSVTDVIDMLGVSSTTGTMYFVTFFDGNFVVGCLVDKTHLLKSPDGINWSDAVSPGSFAISSEWIGFIEDGLCVPSRYYQISHFSPSYERTVYGVFNSNITTTGVMQGSNGRVYQSSEYGYCRTATSLSGLSGTGNMSGITTNNSRYAIYGLGDWPAGKRVYCHSNAGGSGAIYYTTGTTWYTAISSVGITKPMFLTYGSNMAMCQNKKFYTTEGGNLAQKGTISLTSFLRVGGQFVGIKEGEEIVSSRDGVVWEKIGQLPSQGNNGWKFACDIETGSDKLDLSA